MMTAALERASPLDKQWIGGLQEEAFALTDENDRRTAIALSQNMVGKQRSIIRSCSGDDRLAQAHAGDLASAVVLKFQRVDRLIVLSIRPDDQHLLQYLSIRRFPRICRIRAFEASKPVRKRGSPCS